MMHSYERINATTASEVKVLILVVMDDALVHLIMLVYMAMLMYVLILVVMDDALVLVEVGAIFCPEYCLNPCCNG